MIHPSAVIHPKARIDAGVEIGPGVVIDENVRIGPGCVLGPHVYLTGHTTIGAENRFHAGCVIGDAPQDLKYAGEPSRVRIGNRNVFREQVTVHRANCIEEDTVVGSDNFLMAQSHVGHNSVLGDRVVLANGALVGGHVQIHDLAFLSGHCVIHQFTRVGTLALMQGGSAISKDLPPYTVARGANRLCGLNVVGLRRAGFEPAQRLELRRLYHFLFRGVRRLEEVLEEARDRFHEEAARVVLDFIASGQRGFCTDFGARLRASARSRA